MKNVRGILARLLAAAIVLAALAHDADALLTSGQSSVVNAFNSGDDRALVNALDSLAIDDRPHVIEYSLGVLTRGAPHQRPVAVAALVKYADGAALAGIAAQLRPELFQDERRELVRAMGSRKGVLPAIQQFLRDQDVLVRAAAAACIADQKDRSAVGLLLNPPPSLVDFTEIEGDGEDHLYAVSAIGAIRALSGFNAQNTNEILDWWRRAPGPLSQSVPASDVKIKAPVNARLATHSFEIRFDPAEAQRILEDRMHLRSDNDWNRFIQSMEGSARQDRAVAGKIFGPVYAPCCRVVFATRQTVAACGGVSESYGAFTNWGRMTITINVEMFSPIFWQIMFRHEYIHVVHRNQFVVQPRWLSEGLAVSLSESPFRSSWTPHRIASAGLANALSLGSLSATTAWINDFHTGDDESVSYALSGLVLDYLRFGGIPASEQRLFALMGQLNRGKQPRQAIESVYGVSLEKLDADLSQWAAGLPGGAR